MYDAAAAVTMPIVPPGLHHLRCSSQRVLLLLLLLLLQGFDAAAMWSELDELDAAVSRRGSTTTS
jgi:hypothetical protein